MSRRVKKRTEIAAATAAYLMGSTRASMRCSDIACHNGLHHVGGDARILTDAETIESFYRAFQQRDYAGMAVLYHPAIHFSDPVFPDLHGDEARAMWHMLCDQAPDLRVTFTNVTAEGASGRAHWEARYVFSPTGRPVHNEIDATFEFEGGKIIRHIDSFGLWRWTRMALGTMGVLTGWSRFTKGKVQDVADRGLRRFMTEHPEYTQRQID